MNRKSHILRREVRAFPSPSLLSHRGKEVATLPLDLNICPPWFSIVVPGEQKFHGLVLGHQRSISNKSSQLGDFTSSYGGLKTCVWFGSILALTATPGLNRMEGTQCDFAHQCV